MTSTKLRESVVDWIARHPLAAPLLAGAAARLIAATVALGFHARDDYFHVLDPALRLARDSSFDWDASGLPGAGIRSHLTPRALALLIRGLWTLGVSEPETILRVVYGVLGAYSLLLIPAMWLLGRRLLDERGAKLAAWLGALHFFMPYAGTRLLIEALAMPPLVWSLYFASRAIDLDFRDSSFPRKRESRTTTVWLVLSGLLMGLACWFRYQTGTAGLGLAIVVALQRRRDGGLKAATLALLALGVGAAAALAIQGAFDLATTGAFLGPVVKNIQYNLHPPTGLSRSTPFAYVGFLLLLTAPPATLLVVPAMVYAARKMPLVTWPFVLFVLVHSLVPHKEERFILPVLPLFLVLLAAVPQAVRESAGAWGRMLQRAWPATRAFLVVVHLAALLIAITSQSQANVREALQSLRARPASGALVSLGPEIHAFFLNQPDATLRQSGRADAKWFHDTVVALGEQGALPENVMAFASDAASVTILLALEGLTCDEPKMFNGWWLDRLIYKLNPKRNRRRSPVMLWECHGPMVAKQ